MPDLHAEGTHEAVKMEEEDVAFEWRPEREDGMETEVIHTSGSYKLYHFPLQMQVVAIDVVEVEVVSRWHYWSELTPTESIAEAISYVEWLVKREGMEPPEVPKSEKESA